MELKKKFKALSIPSVQDVSYWFYECLQIAYFQELRIIGNSINKFKI